MAVMRFKQTAYRRPKAQVRICLCNTFPNKHTAHLLTAAAVRLFVRTNIMLNHASVPMRYTACGNIAFPKRLKC